MQFDWLRIMQKQRKELKSFKLGINILSFHSIVNAAETFRQSKGKYKYFANFFGIPRQVYPSEI